jgi:hypothetical protein
MVIGEIHKGNLAKICRRDRPLVNPKNGCGEANDPANENSDLAQYTRHRFALASPRQTVASTLRL